MVLASNRGDSASHEFLNCVLGVQVAPGYHNLHGNLGKVLIKYSIIINGYRSVAQLGRAAVSKTAGRGFDSSHSCQSFAEVAELVDALA